MVTRSANVSRGARAVLVMGWLLLNPPWRHRHVPVGREILACDGEELCRGMALAGLAGSGTAPRGVVVGCRGSAMAPSSAVRRTAPDPAP
ncbi:hypothetical protein SGPA1_40039 [Streptomyces misionensis JCM 4497]